MAIFGPKPWVNPFGKMSIFRLFELLLFIAQKGVFSFQKIIKDVFLAYSALKKKWQKWPFLDQNYGLTPLEKCQFFDSFELVVLIVQKGVFCPIFFWPILPKKKKVEKWSFFDQYHLEKCQFFDFLNLFFLQPRKAFFVSRIS